MKRYTFRKMIAAKTNLDGKDAGLVKRAERWLRKGNPLRALRLLERLTKQAWKHPRTERLIWQAATAVLLLGLIDHS